MMRFPAAEFEALLNEHGLHRVSVLMPTGPEAGGQNYGAARLKALLQKAKTGLETGGVRKAEAHSLLRPLQEMVGKADFWQQPNRGVAFYLGSGKLRTFQLPYPVEEQVVISDRFYVKPLFPMLTLPAHLPVLALSQKSARWLKYDWEHLAADRDFKVLAARASMLSDFDAERHILVRSGGRQGRKAAIYYSPGGDHDSGQKKKQLDIYLHRVWETVGRRMREETAPLILVAAEPVYSLFRRMHPRAPLLAQGVAANPDCLTARQLLDSVARIGEAFLAGRQQRELERFANLPGARRPVTRCQEALAAAEHGRIDTLLVSLQDHVWGVCDPLSGRCLRHDQQQPGDEDLLDRAAVRAHRTGARVRVLDRHAMPAAGNVAAALRFGLSQP